MSRRRDLLIRGAQRGWRQRAYEVIFEHDTFAGRSFDVALIVAILASVAVTLMDSVPELHVRYQDVFYALEWGFTLAFSAEYLLRLSVVRRPLRYARSFFGIIDLVAVLPLYLSLLLPGGQYLLVIRALRILRIFRVLKLARYVDEAQLITRALHNSARKIFVFLCGIVALLLVFGALIYLVEGPENGFTSIPLGMYWAVVTMATVGYGDYVPVTALGRFIAGVLILIGYSIIAVPTGIYTAELAQGARQRWSTRSCPGCGLRGHELDATFCRRCAVQLLRSSEEDETERD